MKHIAQREVLRNDRLILVVRDRSNGQVISQGKRVGKDCPLTREEIREYRNRGAIKAARLIAKNRNLSVSDALRLLNQVREYPFQPL